MAMAKNHLLGIILFMLAMPGLALADPPEATGFSSEREAQSLLSAFMAYTDLRIASVRRCVEALAATNEGRSDDWESMRGLLTSYQKSDPGLIVWYMHADGSYYTVDKGRMGVKLTDRSYFPDLLAGRTVTGALVISRSTGQRSAVIAVPVKKDGKVVGAIGTSLFLDAFADQVASALDLPAGTGFFALAPNGLTTLHRKTDRHFLDPRTLGSETLKKAATEMLSGTAGRTTYEFDQATKTALYRTSPLTQWSFAITFDAPPQQ